MFETLYRPALELKGGELVRSSGIFLKKRMRLEDVTSIVAIAKDAVTHDEIMIALTDQRGRSLWISEFDRNYPAVMSSMADHFLGMGSAVELNGRAPFSESRKVLWERSAMP
jgi:hypothetical protein